MRDEFSKAVVETLAKRVGNRCSNSECRKATSGPHTDERKALNVGVAAHITAASPGGVRYDPSLTAIERKEIGNGIWLCQVCGKLVDNDEVRYTKDTLLHWKHEAEHEALRLVESSAQTSDLFFANTEVSGRKGDVGPGGDARIYASRGAGITFISGSIKGGDGGEGGGKGGDAIVEGGSG